MYQIENFELGTSRVARFRLKAGDVIRLTEGRMWLTLQGSQDDIWLRAGDSWTLPANGTIFLSAEPIAVFQMALPIEATRRSQGMAQPLAWGPSSPVAA